MAAVITVMNMKGGVGKTVVSAHVAGMLARYEFNGKRRRVLAIDYDPQFNLSQAFLPNRTYYSLERVRKTSLAILQDDETLLNPYTLQVPGNRTPPKVQDLAHGIYPSKSAPGLLDLVPSTLDLMFLALGQPETRTDVFEERFRKFIGDARRHYDVVIIDCHPAGSILTKTSLQNSDHVLIPVMSSKFAARGVSLMHQFIDAVQSRSGAPVPHILFNCAGRQPSQDELRIRADAHNTGKCLSASLKKFKIFSDPAEGLGFVWFSGRPYSTRAFRNLHTVVQDLVDRTGI